MSHDDLETRYRELRSQLAQAYDENDWDSRRIDAIADAMLPIERQLSGTAPATTARTPAHR